MLKVEHIAYHIGQKALLEDFSADFPPGQLHLILGPNGAGKSTLIKLLSGELPSKQGKVLYENKSITTHSLPELATRRAVLSQNIDLSFPMKVHEVVMMGRYPHFRSHPTGVDFTAIEEAMNFFDIASFRDREYLTLSGGEKQRVHFARVLAQIIQSEHSGCRYLFLDEPLTYLDVYYQFQFMQLLRKLLKEYPLVVVGVVHDLNLAAKFADQLVLLHQGKLLAKGPVHEVLTEKNIEMAYRLSPLIHHSKKGTFLFFE
ncbi:MAG TPA: heme ABC transporter ATP-binding protein [Flavobacteriaceae bacterium]|nr:heme ABC transporter ATP-binding protein [Flavobacteriaceae bacterium]MCB9213279.1 heme ABC transporter ATP-binding protein [Alteromonas sp.]HPF12367.1 heme ABC transporter ATP-binding protein [Flavobacteriaceae bacterium]HQU22593.1 heme ABC transporter ATP-binding protein [Flavobacteriaceae bacterium]HQU66257.1 heme ABC transporter ATP-binding protein [Flavobacteriaceae bacterium]